ncbi:centrosomal protein of 63 kDa isoform X4 [Amblyraja radiata]|uniref:centrosomal protein of 63 kDa isoform X4 n=1 Tax=Amblyraja radiata TaxID=386614 RepID=UPI001401E327|nr:centrosomal protein of 63 kDa isoform X4 [Amblyraja radiata]
MEALLEAVQHLGHDGSVLTTCEAELQELMKQIDIMMAHKKAEWEAQFQSVETRLKAREQELGAIQPQLDQKQTEVDQLRQYLQDSEKTQHDMVVQYESQLNIFQEEIEKLKKSYEKLQRRQFKEAREDMKDRKDRKECMSELNKLNKKVEKSIKENEELNKRLQDQAYIIQSKDLQQKRLCKELARCNEMLQAQEKINSRSSESLKQQYSNISYRQSELQEAVPLHGSPQDSAKEEVLKKREELKRMEAEHSKCKSEVKKLRDQMNLVEQQHHSELKGMKLEISQLTTELHQRDVAIAVMSAATTDMEHQLRREMEKTDRKAKEIKQNCSLVDLQDGYFSSLTQLEQENQRLQQELADVRNKLEMSVKVAQDRYELLLLQIHNKLTDIGDMEDRRVGELQLKHKEELQELQNRLVEMTAKSQDVKRPKQSAHPLSKSDSSNLTDCSGQAGESDYSDAQQRDSPSEYLQAITSYITLYADKNEADFSDSASMQSLRSLHNDQLLPLSPAIESPNTSIAAKFLEEEDKRSQRLLKQLDMHIDELKIESERTVDKFV